jgi:hypothetical protein
MKAVTLLPEPVWLMIANFNFRGIDRLEPVSRIEALARTIARRLSLLAHSSLIQFCYGPSLSAQIDADG